MKLAPASVEFHQYLVIFEDSRTPELPIFARGWEEAKVAAWRMTRETVIAVALKDDVSNVILTAPVEMEPFG
jgi:hypothetical protein